MASSTMDDVDVAAAAHAKGNFFFFLLCNDRSWVDNERLPDGFVGDGVNDVEWWYNCWGLSVNDIDPGLWIVWSFENKLRILAVDNIVWISWISSVFVIDGNANWRTVKRTFIVSALNIGFKLISSFDKGGGRSNCGHFLRKYWTVVWTNNS